MTEPTPPPGDLPATPPPYPGLNPAPPSTPLPTGPPAGIQPKAENATLALVLGIVAVAGGSLCCLAFAVGPFAWVLGQRAVAETRRNPQLAGSSEAMAGMVMGIIATGLLAITALAMIFIFTLVLAEPRMFRG